MNKPPVRILVTAAGGALAPLNIRLLKASARYDVSVFSTDMRPDALGQFFADGFATVPQGDADGYTDRILSLVHDNRIDVVMPWSDEEANALSYSAEAFRDAGAIVACSSPEVLATLTNKARTYSALEAAGIQSMEWALVKNLDHLRDLANRFLADLGEFVVKPTIGRGNRGAIIVANIRTGPVTFQDSRELHMNVETFFEGHATGLLETGDLVVMERLLGPAYDIDVLCDAGRVFQTVARERLNPAGVPFRGNIVCDDRRLVEFSANVAEALRLSYLHDCDLMLRRDGSPVAIEVNPRPSGSVASAILAGVPLYDELIALVRGDELSPLIRPTPQTILPYIDCVSVPAGGGAQQ